VVGFAGFGVPVVGVPLLALLAVEVGVDGHGLGGFEVVDEGVRVGPVSACVPPEGGERCREVRGWGGCGEGGGEGGEGHGVTRREILTSVSDGECIRVARNNIKYQRRLRRPHNDDIATEALDFATQAGLETYIAKLECAQKFEFEKATKLRDQIKDLCDKEFLFI
jgi:hypothetical protein